MSASDRHVVLVGLMATGKSTVGRLLARNLGRSLFDSDHEVERIEGRTVREVFETDGEPAFRALETEVLIDALGRPEPLVVAAAGGVVLDAANRQALKRDDSIVVWLRADPEMLAVRATGGGHRPLLDDDPQARLCQMAADRHALYAEVADLTVDIDDHSPTQIASMIEALL